MRKLIMLIVFLLVILFTSVIVVDERQNAVISNYKKVQVIKSAGIHIAWPILNKVRYVYINERTALLTLGINESSVSNSPIQLEVLISYHVINPIDYLSAVDKDGKVGISEKITKSLVMDVSDTLKTETLAKFNQQGIFSIRQNDYTPLGISLDRVNLLNIKYIPDEKKQIKLAASQPQEK